MNFIRTLGKISHFKSLIPSTSPCMLTHVTGRACVFGIQVAVNLDLATPHATQKLMCTLAINLDHIWGWIKKGIYVGDIHFFCNCSMGYWSNKVYQWSRNLPSYSHVVSDFPNAALAGELACEDGSVPTTSITLASPCFFWESGDSEAFEPHAHFEWFSSTFFVTGFHFLVVIVTLSFAAALAHSVGLLTCFAVFKNIRESCLKRPWSDECAFKKEKTLRFYDLVAQRMQLRHCWAWTAVATQPIW